MRTFEPGMVARATDGNLSPGGGGRGGARPARRVVIDSRRVRPGDLFVAIEGPRHDGHAFLTEAVCRGAVGVVARDFPGAHGVWWVRVEDTLRALQSLARAHRDRFEGVVCAITGSNGKTTTKELLRACLGSGGAARDVAASRASYNNHVGVPLSLLEIAPETRYAVLEIGSSGRGEVRALGALCRPHVAVITSLAESHLAGLGDLRGVAREKGSLLEVLDSGGLAVLNRDLPFFEWFRSLHGGACLSFGFHPRADVRILGVEASGRGLRVRISERGGGTSLYEAGLVGRHNASNLAGAVAVGRWRGIPPGEIRGRLRGAHAPPMRMERHRFGSMVLVNDAYNANPGSMRAAIRSFCDLAGARPRKVAVLGAMLELGGRSRALHRGLGGFAARSGIDLVVGVGPEMREAVRAARREGLGGGGTRWFADIDALLAGIEGVIRPDDSVLLKGSRGAGLERCMESIRRIGQRAAVAVGGGEGAREYGYVRGR